MNRRDGEFAAGGDCRKCGDKCIVLSSKPGRTVTHYTHRRLANLSSSMELLRSTTTLFGCAGFEGGRLFSAVGPGEADNAALISGDSNTCGPRAAERKAQGARIFSGGSCRLGIATA